MCLCYTLCLKYTTAYYCCTHTATDLRRRLQLYAFARVMCLRSSSFTMTCSSFSEEGKIGLHGKHRVARLQNDVWGVFRIKSRDTGRCITKMVPLCDITKSWFAEQLYMGPLLSVEVRRDGNSQSHSRFFELVTMWNVWFTHCCRRWACICWRSRINCKTFCFCSARQRKFGGDKLMTKIFSFACTQHVVN